MTTTAFDISLDIADEIANSKSFASTDNIRHGIYLFRIDRIFAEKVEKGRMAFVEFTVLESKPNPQTQGDLVSLNGQWKLKDDGMNPNPVGSRCALKINFDGNAKQMAGANMKAFIMGLCNLSQADTQGPEGAKKINNTWVDLSRTKPLQKGDLIGIDQATNQPIVYQGDPKGENPACGMLVRCSTTAKEKKKTREVKSLAPEQREWVTQQNWQNVAPPGFGENAPDKVALRRAEAQAALAKGGDDDDDDVSMSTQNVPAAGLTPPTNFAPAPAPVAPAPPAPPAVQAAWSPPAPWRAHPTSPGWYWDGGQGVKSEADLKASFQS
jgi:hypothetical protein